MNANIILIAQLAIDTKLEIGFLFLKNEPLSVGTRRNSPEALQMEGEGGGEGGREGGRRTEGGLDFIIFAAASLAP